ncbi:DNA-binding protein D-ETS-4 isoform X2 [Sitophilus oryzae]|uniref:DNA-binding protein D-ETS-4 isoform X2 n=1 Tax=Sitophilus oryzae TaxID=7048 RepID=A0A6J2YY66_SITOR|nr:DNA-binding protein D-ETS-4 isoform X2 [Sitophilus oryzae]
MYIEGYFSVQMPQTVPSAGFTPPCDYSNFAENFDLSLLPGGDQPIPTTLGFYHTGSEKQTQPKIFTTFYPSSPESQSLTSDNEFSPDFQPDFQKLLGDNKKYLSAQSPIHLEVPQPNSLGHHSTPGSLSPYSPSSQGLLSPNDQYSTYRDQTFYPSSPEYSLYTSSPSSIYSKSPCEEYLHSGYIKKEDTYSNSTSPLPNFSPFSIKEENFLPNLSLSSPVSPAASNYSCGSSPEQISQQSGIFDPQKQIKQESTVDFSEILGEFPSTDTLRSLLQQKPQDTLLQTVPDTPKDHQLLRQVLRDTSFQKKFNIRPIDFSFVNGDIKMEDGCDGDQADLMMGCEEQISRESIEPVLTMAIEQMRKDVGETCSALGISPDPAVWSPSDVLSWIRWTSRQFNCPEPTAENWEISGSNLLLLSEKDFTNRAPQGGMILHAQLEIWKAAYSEESVKNWIPETTSGNASGGDISEDEDEEVQPPSDQNKPTTSRTGTHIHLWQFLKELLSTPQTHGSCIRWLDRTKGIFKIEDSVKVARLWGKRKNRPAMNYDKLSRSIRQYYKKGIMKKTERSQRLVYQFCHPYNL